jgi:hypothetical protein
MAGAPSFRGDRGDFLGGPSQAKRLGARRGWEHRKEADEAVEVNLSPDERGLWRKLKGRWRGAPHARLEAFRHYLHDHPGELRAERAGHGEARAKVLVRERERAAFSKAPCAPPYRSRNRRACKGDFLSGSAGGVEIPCREPYRYRTKDLCNPKAKWKAAYVPPAEEHANVFEGLF